MSPGLETIHSEAPVSIVGDMRLDLRLGALPIADPRGDLIGIIIQTPILGEAMRRFRADEGQRAHRQEPPSRRVRYRSVTSAPGSAAMLPRTTSEGFGCPR
jgi:CBS-domain-containing membrane protein